MRGWGHRLLALADSLNFRIEKGYNPTEQYTNPNPREKHFVSYVDDNAISIVVSKNGVDIGFTSFVISNGTEYTFKSHNKTIQFPHDAPEHLPKVIVTTIYINPDYRGQGIGKLIQHKLVDYLNEQFGVGQYSFIQGISTNDGERMIEYRRKLLPPTQPYYILDHRKKEKDNGTFQETASP